MVISSSCPGDKKASTPGPILSVPNILGSTPPRDVKLPSLNSVLGMLPNVTLSPGLGVLDNFLILKNFHV